MKIGLLPILTTRVANSDIRYLSQGLGEVRDLSCQPQMVPVNAASRTEVGDRKLWNPGTKPPGDCAAKPSIPQCLHASL